MPKDDSRIEDELADILRGQKGDQLIEIEKDGTLRVVDPSGRQPGKSVVLHDTVGEYDGMARL